MQYYVMFDRVMMALDCSFYQIEAETWFFTWNFNSHDRILVCFMNSLLFKFVCKGPIISTSLLLHTMTWYSLGKKPLPKPNTDLVQWFMYASPGLSVSNIKSVYILMCHHTCSVHEYIIVLYHRDSYSYFDDLKGNIFSKKSLVLTLEIFSFK